jgi:hypothetical protein
MGRKNWKHGPLIIVLQVKETIPSQHALKVPAE